ncbi:glycosyltransferase family 4 protein [Klebsiella variicola]|uniref:glycosyltransferase family 4 protein n=1 Tax=Klebsiella TaxID=570 RepID=UPI0023818407|nr:glycosyltransferase family 4 protein [Klebsiella variicola]MDE4640959.1 glycosyltransferase family 4 protein [Klebsiella variicola]HCI6538780.1 glycosyltransferase family 4 protein [Klebsiella variicola subsp. variicola]
MSRIKVLYILPDLSNAGPVNMCLSLIKGLDKTKFDIHVAALGSGELIHQFENFSSVKIYPRTKILNFLKESKMGNYDIIHSHTIISDLFSSTLCSSAKKITTIHNYPDIDSVFRRGRIVGGGLYILQKIAISSMLKVACSISVRDYCTNKLNLRKVIAIPNGVSPSAYPIRNENVDSGTINFYYLGSITARKNVEELLLAFSEWSINKNAKLNIIGGGDLLEALSLKYNDRKIKYYGKLSDPAQTVIDFDCFVSASRAEGMPLALLEALSLGKAYICSNIEPHVEVYKSDNGRSGFIYELGNKEQLIQSFDKYYNTPNRAMLSQNAKQCFDLYYDMRIMSEHYSKLYFEMSNKVSI